MTSTLTFKKILLAGCSTAGVLIGSQAFAQTEDLGKLEEITVTANRRVENQQRVPVTVTAITPESLEKQGVVRTDELGPAVPGLIFGHEISAATVFLRGVGPSSNGSGEESSVAIYLDDLYIESGDAAIFQLNSIQSIEVLSGPQGTLFGRNATGGVINIKTKDPSKTPSLDAHVGFGNYDSTAADLYVTGGIIDKLSANLAVFRNYQPRGWGRDVTTGGKAFTSKDWGILNKYKLEIGDDTTLLLSLGHNYTRGEVGLGMNQVPGSHGVGGTGYVGFFNTADINNDWAHFMRDSVSLRIDHDFGFVKLVDIAGWQRENGIAHFNQDASPVGAVDTDLHRGGKTLSEEIRLLSPDNASYSSWLNWIVGGFYMHDKSGYPNSILRGAAFHFPLQTTPPSFYINLTDDVKTDSYAGFAQATVQVLEGTHLTAGARFTSDTRKFEGGLTLSRALGGMRLTHTNYDSPGAEHTWSKLTFRFALDHQFTDDIMGYVSFNRGFRSGQYDTFGTASTGPIATPPVAPEILDAIEVGVKTEFFDHRLRFNADYFHYDYSNIQFAAIVPGGTKLINAAHGTIDGGELNFETRPFTNLTVSDGISVLYGYYDNFKNAPDYFTPSCLATGTGCLIDASGNEMVRTPHFSNNVSFDYLIPTSQGEFDLNGSYSFTAPFQWVPDGSLKQRPVNLVNAAVLWTMPGGRYDIRLWGRNLLDQHYYSFASESQGLGKLFSPEAPLTFGVTFGLHL